MALGDVIARLSVELGLDSAAFTKGSVKASRDVDKLGDRMEKAGHRVGGAIKGIAAAGAGLATGFLAAKIGDAVKSSLDFASSLGETAQQLGVTTKTLQEYRYAATQAGLSQDEMDASLAKLTRTIGEAAEGGDKQSEAFAKLGVNIRDANGNIREAGDLMPLIADGLQKLQSPAERAAVLVDLFGKSGQKLAPLLAEGSKGINNLRDAAQKLGIVLSDEQIQKADDTADKLAALQTVLSAKIASAVADNADSILTLANALVKLVDAAGRAVRAWDIYIGAIRNGRSVQEQALKNLGPGVQLTFSPAELAARKAAASVTGAGAARNGGGAAPFPTVNRTCPLFLGGGFKPGAGPLRLSDSGFSSGSNLAKALAAADAGRGGLERLAALAEQVPPAVGGMVDRVAQEMLRLDSALAQPADNAADAVTERFRELAQAVGPILDRLFPDAARLRRFQDELDLLRQAGAAGVPGAEGAISALRGEFAGEGIDKGIDAFERFARAANDNAEKVRGANVRIAASFKETAEATLSALDRMAQAIKGGGFLDILGAVIGLGIQLGSAGLFGKKIATNINKPTPRASGGPVAAGRLHLVGERGPELFVSGRSGSIIPNDRLGGTVVNYNFNGVMTTEQFQRDLQAGHAQAAQGGAVLAQSQEVRRRKWALA